MVLHEGATGARFDYSTGILNRLGSILIITANEPKHTGSPDIVLVVHQTDKKDLRPETTPLTDDLVERTRNALLDEEEGLAYFVKDVDEQALIAALRQHLESSGTGIGTIVHFAPGIEDTLPQVAGYFGMHPQHT